jgi:hypothetical protein
MSHGKEEFRDYSVVAAKISGSARSTAFSPGSARLIAEESCRVTAALGFQTCRMIGAGVRLCIGVPFVASHSCSGR